MVEDEHYPPIRAETNSTDHGQLGQMPTLLGKLLNKQKKYLHTAATGAISASLSAATLARPPFGLRADVSPACPPPAALPAAPSLGPAAPIPLNGNTDQYFSIINDVPSQFLPEYIS